MPNKSTSKSPQYLSARETGSHIRLASREVKEKLASICDHTDAGRGPDPTDPRRKAISCIKALEENISISEKVLRETLEALSSATDSRAYRGVKHRAGIALTCLEAINQAPEKS